MTNQFGVFLLVTGQVFKKLGGTGLGDGAQMLDDLVPGHADAVVADGERPGFFVDADTHFEVTVAFVEAVIFQGFEAQFVRRIGGVGDELAQEDLAVGVERVDHQVQQLFGFGLESKRFFMGVHGHGCVAPVIQLALNTTPNHHWSGFEFCGWVMGAFGGISRVGACTLRRIVTPARGLREGR